MTAVAPIPPISWLANDAVTLLDAIVAKHGGAELLGTAGMEIALSLVRLHGDVRATSDGMTRVRLLEGVARLSALLPAPAGPAAAVTADGEAFDSDASIAVFVVGELSDDDLLALAAGLREFAPNAETLAGLVERNVAVEGQLRDAQLALSMRDFVRLNECLASVPDSGGRVDLVERLRRDLAALGAEVEALRGERVGAVYGKRASGAAQERPGATPAGQARAQAGRRTSARPWPSWWPSIASRRGGGLPAAAWSRPIVPRRCGSGRDVAVWRRAVQLGRVWRMTVADTHAADAKLVYDELVERRGLVRMTDKALAARIANVLSDGDASGADLRVAVEALRLLPAEVVP
jgi:hypothetical protein